MADTTVPGRTRSDLLEESRVVTSRGKLESALLVILAGTAAVATTTDVKASAPAQIIEQAPVTISRGKTTPLISILSFYPSDVVNGFDNFEGWPPPPPPFIQQQTHAPLLPIQTSYAAYNPAPDIIYRQFRRTPQFFDEPPFLQPQRAQLLTGLSVKPPPPGDLTTLLRRPQNVFPAPVWEMPWKGAWHVALMPQLAPPPVIPPAPPVGPWPLPPTDLQLAARGAWELPGGTQALWVIGDGCFLMTVMAPATVTTRATFVLRRVGTLKTQAGPVCIRDNGPGGYAVIVDGPYGYLYNIATRAFAPITDPAFLGADRVAFIDGWWIFNQPGTQVFYTNAVQYGIAFNGSMFALKDGATDKLVTLMENKQELWLPGEKTTEIWYDAGGQFFPFQRLVSTMLQVGCSAKHSIARYSAGGETGLVWLAKSERGENVVIKTQGFAVEPISSHAIANAIATYPIVSDAIGYVYQEDGHEFYVLTFPTADATWVFDFSTELWHRRASYDPYAGRFHRHRSNCFINFQNQRLVGDYQNGAIYRMDRAVYTDDGQPLVGWRRTRHIWDGGARGRVFMASLQIEFAPGVGRQSGLGSDPQAFLSLSRDGGTTWGKQVARALGKVGSYLNRVIWRRLGFARDTVIDVKVSDPVNRDIVGATLKAASGE